MARSPHPLPRAMALACAGLLGPVLSALALAPGAALADTDAPAGRGTATLVWGEDEPPSTLVWGPDHAPVDPVAERPGPTPTGTQAAKPLVGVPLLEPFPAPNLGGGLPSAYVANWGDYFLALSGGTPGNQRDGVVDGSVNMGMGFGDAYRLIAVEADWNIGSVKNFNFNGSFNLLASRVLVNQPRLQVVAGGGVQDLFAYGNEAKPPATGYGVLTVATPLRQPNLMFNQVLQVSVGVGGNNFTYLNENFEGADASLFTAVGLELSSNVGLSMGWSGRGTNANLSYTPFRDLPFTINLLGADLFATSPFGTVGVLTVSWGDNFRTGLF